MITHLRTTVLVDTFDIPLVYVPLNHLGRRPERSVIHVPQHPSWIVRIRRIDRRFVLTCLSL
jgi:hypothetical protein